MCLQHRFPSLVYYRAPTQDNCSCNPHALHKCTDFHQKLVYRCIATCVCALQVYTQPASLSLPVSLLPLSTVLPSLPLNREALIPFLCLCKGVSSAHKCNFDTTVCVPLFPLFLESVGVGLHVFLILKE